MLELNKIYQAKQKIADFVSKTPFIHSSFLSELCKSEVYLKMKICKLQELIKFAVHITK